MNQIKEEAHTQAGHLKLMMSGNLLSGLWSVQTRGKGLALAILSDFVPASFQKLLAAQHISPHLDASFDATKLMIATGALDIQDGRLPLPGVSAEQDRFKQLQFQFDYSRQDDLLSISEAQLLLPDGRSLVRSWLRISRLILFCAIGRKMPSQLGAAGLINRSLLAHFQP